MVAGGEGVNYSSHGLVVVRTATFDGWLRWLKDPRAVARITVRIDRLAGGNAGDVRPIGSGLSELRINHGPGFRVYYLQDGDRLVVLLCGGDKSSQSADVRRAHLIADEWRKHESER